MYAFPSCSRVLRCLSRDRSCPQRQAVRQTTVVVEGSYSVDPTNPSMPNHPEGGHVLHHVGVQGIHHGAQGLEEQPSVPYNSNDKRSECQPQHPPPPYEETSPSERYVCTALTHLHPQRSDLLIKLFSDLKLCLATAIHSFKSLTICV